MPPREAKCEVCGVPFTTNAPNRKICGSKECERATWRRLWHAKYKKTRLAATWNAPRSCEICGREFVPKVRDQASCGDKECRKALQRRRERDRAKGIYTPRATAKRTTVQGINAWGEYDMPCPFHAMDYLPPGVASWHESIMMPVI